MSNLSPNLLDSNENKPNFNLNMHVHRLLQDEPFFAALSRRVNKQASKAIPTAGVCVNPETYHFEMLYNPDFFAEMPEKHVKGVLIHEFYHLVFEHVTSRKPEGVPHLMWNIAADLSINCLIGKDNLPENCCYPGEGQFEKYPSGKTAEYYLKMIQDDEQFKNEGGEGSGNCEGSGEGSGSGEGESGNEPGSGKGKGLGDGQFDSHEGWGEVSEEARQIAHERMKDMIKKASDETNSQSRGWGSVSSQVKKDIMERLKTRINWKKVLRAFIGNAQRADRTSSIKRINRRFPYIHAGRKVNRIANIAISIDQSGSVSDAELNAFFSELNKLADLATFTVIPFDSRVAEDKVYVWKKGEKRKWQRVLYGGTNFDAPTAYVNKRNFDGHIVLTDLYAPKPKASRCRRMWMASKQNVDNAHFKTNERIIAIDIKQ
jgi:predicted metal-dependent peptidase